MLTVRYHEQPGNFLPPVKKIVNFIKGNFARVDKDDERASSSITPQGVDVYYLN